MGMTTLPPGSGVGGPIAGTGMLPADEAKAYADWQNAGGQGDFQFNPQQMPPVNGLPTQGMGGGKGGLDGGAFVGAPMNSYDANGNLVLGGVQGNGPQVGALNQAIGQPQSPTTNGMGGGKGGSPVPSQNPPVSQFPGQQQPMTQGTGQLPPGFGALSPIDRSQIGIGQIGMTSPMQGAFSGPTNTMARNPLAPNAPQGMFGNQGRAPVGGMQGIPMPGRTPAPGPRMNDLTYGAMQGRQAVVPTTNRQMTPLQQNRFAPPNAPGVRTGIARPRVR